MPLQHACFISYRHAQHDLMRRFVDEFYESLASELEALVDLKVYRDILRLQGGDFYNENLARSLCESVCMVMIFTPTYFSEANTYCTREYAAMKAIEAARLKPDAEHGLIIPVVLRNFDELPHEIKSKRQVYRFEHFLTSDPRLSKSKKGLAEIGRLAQYVAARCRELRQLEVDCRGYTMPGDEAVRALAAQLTSPPPLFPGREAADG
jgi:hypothetical protein